MSQFLWYDCTLKNNVPSLWHLAYDGNFDYDPISVLYKVQIDISTNNREIKYQNIGRTQRHADRQTGSKQYIATSSGAR